MRGRIPGEGREVRSLDFTKDPEYPRFASDLKFWKRTERREKRKEGRIEEDGVAGGRWRHGEETMELKGKSEPRVTQIFINNIPFDLLQSSIYRIWRGRTTRKRRVAPHSSCGQLPVRGRSLLFVEFRDSHDWWLIWYETDVRCRRAYT